MNTSPRFNVKGNAFEMVSSPTFEAEVQKRMSLVEWINTIVPHFYLSVKASDEEMRASLLDGDILSQILFKLKYTSNDEMDDSSPSPESKKRKIQRFISVMSEIGLPSFETSDLEKGSMKPVLDCLLALKEHSMPNFGGSVLKAADERRKALSDSKFQRACSPLSPESPTKLLHGGNKLHEVFQMKQGFYTDLSATKISEMLKSNSLDNAPTQSLLSVINGILDESIERKNAEIPQRVACLLRKVVLEIERRIATQAEHLRTQSNLFKAREDKYQSRIKVLEALAKGTSEESEIVMNQLQHIKSEKSKMEEKKKFEQQDTAKLQKLKDENDVEVSTLKQELEMTKRMHELRYMELETQAKLVRFDLEKRLMEQEKLLEDSKVKTEDLVEVSTLKQELEMAKKTNELHSLQLESEAKSVKSDLEKRLRKQEQLLEDSKVKIKELEMNCQTKDQRWTKKEHVYEAFLKIQWSGLEELKHTSDTIKQEMLLTQRTYLEELNQVGTKLKKLAKAAQSYHEVLNENRKLFNELQDLKGNIRVYCRVRPFRSYENQKQTILESIGEHGEMTVTNPTKPNDSQKSFRFNKVYGPMSTQAEVFSDTQPLIRTILDGYNVCIFAYGQTGSGKTYTMSGPDNAAKEDWGVNYRALDDLFQISEDRRSFFSYEIGVQMIEIYNEQIRDLLSSDGSQKKLGILATPQAHGLAVPDASMHPVRSTEDVIELMDIGLSNRSVSSTAMNERSSRSHSVVTIHVQGKDLKSGATSHGSLHLVDLAGSERVDRSEATGDRLKEAQHINKSLSALGDVIFSLSQKNPHVPYRNSKLTQVLQASLGGRAKTLMFVQVNPDVSSYSESLSTLKFAERVSGVELGAARSSKEGRDVRELMDQMASLKDTIAKKDEEIERLQKDPRSPISRRSLKNGPSSPSTKTISPKVSSLRRMGTRPKSTSDQDDFPSYYDPSIGSIHEDENEGLRSSLSMNDLTAQNTTGLGDSSTDERFSEISDGDLSVGTDTETSSSHEVAKPSNIADKRADKPRTVSRISQPSRLATARVSTGISRLSEVKTTLRAASALKKPASGSSSPAASASRRR
ncbi:kinesin-like protein KIN-14P isoform X1 [Spinacia oleracea]|uniref:Kinesin-like protein KIN-14P n=1 Tax=Spinacia oleracea TaxID=3562 RepID=A0A9R0K4F2_SPIOL|nr:kinesin-like protein KIN-14P isoform X1 [Spinacia oleracea]XP_021857175.1 kinesin-like protein KIN-14P isoform X1 [Spinacia oleracea]